MTMRGVSDIHENYEYNSSVYQIQLRGEGHVLYGLYYRKPEDDSLHMRNRLLTLTFALGSVGCRATQGFKE